MLGTAAQYTKQNGWGANRCRRRNTEGTGYWHFNLPVPSVFPVVQIFLAWVTALPM